MARCGNPTLLRPLSGFGGRGRPLDILIQASVEFVVELRVFARIPVALMTIFTGVVQVCGGVPEFIDILAIRDVHNLSSDIPQRLNSGVAFDRIFFTFAIIAAGDSSTVSGPVLFFRSSGPTNGRRTFVGPVSKDA